MTRMTPSRHLFSWLLTFSLALTVQAAPNLDAEPKPLLEAVSARVLKRIVDERERLQGDTDAVYALVTEELLPIIDVPYITALILGQHYRKSNEAQRKAFSEAFSTQLIRRYADALLEYGGEKVEFLPHDDNDGGNKTKVRSRVYPNSGMPVSVVYSLRQGKDKRWGIYNVSVDGIDMVTNFRGQLDSAIKRNKRGLDGVIDDIQSGTLDPAGKQ